MLGIGVIVAFHEPLMRLGIRTACVEGGLDVAGEAGDQAAVRHCARQMKRQCVIVSEIGVLAPDPPGTVREVVDDHRVLVLDAGELDRPRLLRAGASGFVRAQPDRAALCRAIAAADAGELVLPAAEPPRRDMPTGAAPMVELTRREREVLAQLASGNSTDRAARELHMSASTLKTHLRNANAKLGTSNRAAATARATALGVVG